MYFGGSASGAYAELSLCEQTQVHALSANASFAQGAAVNVPYATAYHALFHRGPRRTKARVCSCTAPAAASASARSSSPARVVSP